MGRGSNDVGGAMTLSPKQRRKHEEVLAEIRRAVPAGKLVAELTPKEQEVVRAAETVSEGPVALPFDTLSDYPAFYAYYSDLGQRGGYFMTGALVRDNENRDVYAVMMNTLDRSGIHPRTGPSYSLYQVENLGSDTMAAVNKLQELYEQTFRSMKDERPAIVDRNERSIVQDFLRPRSWAPA